MMHYIIPARAGSKGFPHKNRILFKHTAETLEGCASVIVSTDDEDVKRQALEYDFTVIDRSADLANDTANIRDVLIDVFEKTKAIGIHDTITMLYLTYPERTWDLIRKAQDYFFENKCQSLLCAESVLTHPYLTIYDNGKKVIDHDLYRRQDYPECLEISHAIFISTPAEIFKLNNNLYNEYTSFFRIDRMSDIDYEKDFNA